MHITDVPFITTDWNKIPSITHPGESGKALWRTLEVGNIRVRMVEYTANYLADHWCSRGHVLLVLEGELITELKLMSTDFFDCAFVIRASAIPRCG
jgi:hypothetical protein